MSHTARGILRLSVRRLPGVSLANALSLITFRGLAAQSTTSLIPDAAVLRKHTLGVRVLTGFARWDELLGAGGNRNIAASFNADSLGGAQIHQLTFTESQIRALSGRSNFSVNAGRI